MSATTDPNRCIHTHVMLRGGRMTKLGKQVASYAPMIGLVGAAAIFGASDASAQAQDRFLSRAEAEALQPALPTLPTSPILYNEPPDLIPIGTCGAGTVGGTVNCSPTNVHTNATGAIVYTAQEQLTLNVDGLTLGATVPNGVSVTGSGTTINVQDSSITKTVSSREGSALFGANDGGATITIRDSYVGGLTNWAGTNNSGWQASEFDADGWATGGSSRPGARVNSVQFNRNVLQGFRGDLQTKITGSLVGGANSSISHEQFGYDGLNEMIITDSTIIDTTIRLRTASNFSSGTSPNTQDTVLRIDRVDGYFGQGQFSNSTGLQILDSSFGSARMYVTNSNLYQFRTSGEPLGGSYKPHQAFIILSDWAPVHDEETVDTMSEPRFSVTLPDRNSAGVLHILSSDIFTYLDSSPGILVAATGYRVGPIERPGFEEIPGTTWYSVTDPTRVAVDVEVLIDRMDGGERSRLALLGNSVPGSIVITAATLEANVNVDVRAAEIFAPEGSTAILTFTSPSTATDTYLSKVTVSGDTAIWGGGHILEHLLGDLDAQFIGPDLELAGSFSIAGGTADLLFEQVNLSGVTTIVADYDAVANPGVRKNLEFRGVTTSADTSRDAGTLRGWSNMLVSEGSDLWLSGTLVVGTAGVADTGLTIDPTSRLSLLASGLRIEGNLNNFGTVDLSAANGTPDTVLTVTGNYAAASDLLLDVVLGDDTSASDLLVVGGTTSGTTNVFVTNVGGTGARTVQGILVVDVGDPDNSTGDFMLANGDYTIASTGEAAIIAGAYGYALRDVDGDWYLQSSLPDQSPIWQPATAVYEALPKTLLGMTQVSTLAQRLEGRQVLMGGDGANVPDSDGGPLASDPSKTSAWLRIEGDRLDVASDVSTTGVSFEQSTWRLQGGLDIAELERASGTWVAGINLFTGDSSVALSSASGDGAISTDAVGMGLTATWYGNTGFYTDVQLQYSSFDNDLSSNVLGTIATGVGGEGRLASIEIGNDFELQDELKVVPQAQLTWSEVSFDSFTGPSGEVVSHDTAESLELRLGVAAERHWDINSDKQARLYGIANLIHEMKGTTNALVDGTELTMASADWVGEIGLGGSYDWTSEQLTQTSLYGEVSASRALAGGELRGLAGTVGVRVQW